MFNNNDHPSILAYLAKHGEANLGFIKPKPGVDLNILHTDAFLNQLRVVQLSVSGRTCVPFHRHKLKEKTYIVVPSQHGAILPVNLGIINPETGAMHIQEMRRSGETFVVPKDHWHTLWMPTAGPAHNQLVVVSSSQDGADVEWTIKGDLLVQIGESIGHDCQDESPLQLPFNQLEQHLDTLLMRK